MNNESHIDTSKAKWLEKYGPLIAVVVVLLMMILFGSVGDPSCCILKP